MFLDGCGYFTVTTLSRKGEIMEHLDAVIFALGFPVVAKHMGWKLGWFEISISIAIIFLLILF